jgi:hypothetical protein
MLAATSFLETLQMALTRGSRKALIPMIHPEVLESFGSQRCAVALAPRTNRYHRALVFGLTPVETASWRNASGELQEMKEGRAIFRVEIGFSWESERRALREVKAGTLVMASDSYGSFSVFPDCSKRLCERLPESPVC